MAPLLLFFCPVYVFSCCFGLVPRDSTSTILPFSSLAGSLVFVTLTHSLSLSLIISPFPCFLSFLPSVIPVLGMPRLLLVSPMSSPVLFPARTSSVPTAWIWGVEMAVSNSGDPGVWRGRLAVLVRRETHGSLLGVGFWPLVTMGRWLDNRISHQLTGSFGETRREEKRKRITYTARPHGGMSNS